MNTQAKTVVSIAREAASLSAITDLQGAIKAAMQADGTEAAKIQACAKVLASQVKALDLPLASRVALIRATYADEFSALASTKDLTKEQAKRKSNAIAGLVAAITCYCAESCPVETKAPADGKPAEFKPAGELSLSAMKAAAATVKETVKAEEQKAAATVALAAMTPEQQAAEKAANETKTREAAAAALVAKNKIIHEADAGTIKELGTCLGRVLGTPDLRELLDAAFLVHGLKLSKAAKPSGETLAAQLASLTK